MPFLLFFLAGAVLGGSVCWELATAREKAKNAARVIDLEINVELAEQTADYWRSLCQQEHRRCEMLARFEGRN